MLSNIVKKELRDYFGVKNITASKIKEGIYDVNVYYNVLFSRREKLEQEKKLLEEKKTRRRKASFEK